LYVGCAGWAIRPEHRELFAPDGSHLERYASRYPAVEINSSFYRPHKPATYARWAETVPAGFSFAVKTPKLLTHERQLLDTGPDLTAFLREASALGPKLGCLLVQLPPGLAYDPRTVETFLTAIRARHRGPIVFEPRHASWFTGAADRRLEAHRVGRVLADPICAEGGEEPGGWGATLYIRLHGSPVMYHSSYDEAYLDRVAARMTAAAQEADAVWCIFDNTARGAATVNALDLLTRLSS
jgi:uncharacterized protein YecE (DUF72 family)